MSPEGCGQKAEEARYSKQRPGIRPELVKSQNCHTRNVLGCHRHDKERDGNPDQTGDGKYRRNKYRVWPERADGNARIGRENICHHRHEDSRRNRKQPLEPRHNRPNHHDRQCNQGHLCNGLHRCKAQHQQDSREHCVRDRCRNRGHGPRQRFPLPRDNNQYARNDKRPDCCGKSSCNHLRTGQQRSSQSRPRNRNRQSHFQTKK